MTESLCPRRPMRVIPRPGRSAWSVERLELFRIARPWSSIIRLRDVSISAERGEVVSGDVRWRCPAFGFWWSLLCQLKSPVSTIMLLGCFLRIACSELSRVVHISARMSASAGAFLLAEPPARPPHSL